MKYIRKLLVVLLSILYFSSTTNIFTFIAFAQDGLITQNGKLTIAGKVEDKNFHKMEVQVDDGIPLILSAEDVKLIPDEEDEYIYSKTLENLSDSYHRIIIRAYDLAGNTTEKAFQVNKQKENVFLERNNIDTSEVNTSAVSNLEEHVKDNDNYFIKRKVVSGEPFDIRLFSCFHDDGGLGLNGKAKDGVEVYFEIQSHKFEVSYNGSEFKDITDNLTSLSQAPINKCFNIQSFGLPYAKLNCTDSSLNPCLSACSKLDGHKCNVEIFNSSLLNNFDKSVSAYDFFNPQKDNLDPKNQWEIGSYKFRFAVNENPNSCSIYGTCLSKYEEKTNETYTYEIDVVREPKVEIVLPKEYKKLKFNADNEVKFKIIVKDNLPFNLSTTNNRKPTLDLSKVIWTGLAKSQITESNLEIKIVSEQIDPNDPRNYVFDLTTNVQPKSLNKIELEIPAIFPRDIFNPEGIIISKKITLKVNATFDAEIVSPPNGSIIKDIVKVTSKVAKPKELEGNLSLFTNCKGSVIYYGIRPYNTTEIKTFQFVSKKGEKQIPKSKGKEQVDVLTFEDKLNLNLKTSNEYEKSFLDGSVFGPIELYGEYSTLCNPENIDFTGEPKTYVLLDHPEILKGKCFYPNGSSYSRCHFTASNNTILDEIKALQLEIIPDKGIIDPSCKIPLVTFKNKNDLTKKIEINCLPKEATSFEIKLKRNPSFLAEIEKRFLGTDLEGTTITSNENAVIVDRKVYEVKNVQPSEDDIKAAFEIGDDNEKTATFNGKTITVRELKQLLFDLGLITQTDLDAPAYTNEVNQAYWKLTCAIEEAKQSTLDPNLRLQTADSPLMCTVSYFEGYPDIKYIEDVSSWKEFILGLKTKVGNEISAYVNPTTIQTIAVFIALTTFLSPPAWVIFVAGFALAGMDISVRINDVKKLWNDPNDTNYSQTSNWKAGYSVGTLLTAVPNLIPANVGKNVKAAEIASKLDEYTELQKLIIGEQRAINELKGLVPQGQRQDVLNNFVTFLKDIPDKIQDFELSGISLLNKTTTELKALGKEAKLIELFSKDTSEVGNIQILKNILTDEVQAEAVTRAGKLLDKDLASAIVSVVDDTTEYKPLSTFFVTKGYENISKVIQKENVPRFESRFVKPDDLQKYNLPEKYKDLQPEQVIEQVNSGVIKLDELTGNVSSGSMANFITPTEPVQSLTAAQVNESAGLGLGIPDSDFKGLIEIQIDLSKLPANNEIRLPISVLGNRYFKPTKLNSNSGVTIGNYLEWTIDEISALAQDGIIVKIKGLPRNE